MKCVQLQASMEHALKALTVACGERVQHKHTLNELWDDVEQAGETIRATRDRPALDVLTRYGGELQYGSPGPEHDPEVTWNDTQDDGRRPAEPREGTSPGTDQADDRAAPTTERAPATASWSRQTNEK